MHIKYRRSHKWPR